MWLHSLKVAQLLRSAACLHTNQSRSYLNHLVLRILSVCVAFLMRHIMSPPEACLAVSYFSTSSHTRHDLREKGIEHEMCVPIFSTTPV